MKISLSHWIMLGAIAVMAVGCAHQRSYNLPPAQQLMEPGPGVGGPGPGVLAPAPLSPACGGPRVAPPTVQLNFNKPTQTGVSWDISGTETAFSDARQIPFRATFPQGGIYRLKLTSIANRAGLELYPTLEVGPVVPQTEAYLAHNAIPVQFTEEDFDQVTAGNFVTKVIYLPDPEFQELALAGVEELVSTRLDPGIDPIVEADRRGSILAIIRLGNKILERSEGDVMPQMVGGMMPQMVGGVMPTAAIGGMCGPGAGGMGPGMAVPYGNVPSYLSGVTVPQYGMPISGTPIGLPGPPHIPLGTPAGLQKHVMRNHTPLHIPEPVHKLRVDVRSQPGYSYPKPPTHVKIHEQNIYPPIRYGQPWHTAHQQVQ